MCVFCPFVFQVSDAIFSLKIHPVEHSVVHRTSREIAGVEYIREAQLAAERFLTK